MFIEWMPAILPDPIVTCSVVIVKPSIDVRKCQLSTGKLFGVYKKCIDLAAAATGSAVQNKTVAIVTTVIIVSSIISLVCLLILKPSLDV